jgi:arylsulfatase A-like enzyme
MLVCAVEPDRPNILWITSEDNSKHFVRAFDPTGAPMPHVERLAAEGIRFTRTFSNAPVCSPARSALISGTYGPRVGAHYHRRAQFAPLPEGLRLYPWYLRDAGYYVSNNVKTDYNFPGNPWHESSDQATWRNRAPSQPFFHVQNHTTTHEHRLHFPAEDLANVATETDPASVTLHPRHPDTPLFRYTYARYHDQHRLLDRQIGELLAQLEADGLRDNTIIFYFGDNGGVLPGSKGYLREAGLHVPLVVWFPERWKHLAPAAAGSEIAGFVEFVDLAPTLLNLLGLPIPEAMDGRPFLGPGVDRSELAQRNEALGYADRFDEKHDLSRSLRQGDFKYVRNYLPFIPDGLRNTYRYRMLAYREWHALHRAGKLYPVQARFFEPKPPEELYDLAADPHETRNLAADPTHRATLLRLRARLRERLAAMPDLGFIPEPVFLAQGIENPVRYGLKQRATLARLMDIADLPLRPAAEALAQLQPLLENGAPLERYWALIAATALGKEAATLAPSIRRLASDGEDRLVATRAAEFLAIVAGEDPRPVLTRTLRRAGSAVETSLILNTVVTLQDHYGYAAPSVAADWFPEAWRDDATVGPRLRYLADPATR